MYNVMDRAMQLRSRQKSDNREKDHTPLSEKRARVATRSVCCRLMSSVLHSRPGTQGSASTVGGILHVCSTHEFPMNTIDRGLASLLPKIPLGLLCLLIPLTLRAGTISGSVAEPSGSLIPGVRIEITGGELTARYALVGCWWKVFDTRSEGRQLCIAFDSGRL
jgi:hypothetical protein